MFKRFVLSLFVCVVLLLFGGVGVAFGGFSPWWRLVSGSRPSVLRSGFATNEVQRLTISATKGEVFLANLKEVEEGIAEELLFTVLPYNASALQVQEGLEKVFPSRRVLVSGGPGDEGGSKPYVITFPGQTVPLVFASGEFAEFFGGEPLSGGTAETSTSVTEVSKGRPDGQVVVTAANLGDASIDGGTVPVSFSDVLPVGLRAVSVEGIAGSPNNHRGPVDCSLGSLTCAYAKGLPPFYPIEVLMGVEVLSSSVGSNVVSVSGGGAPGASVSRPVRVGGELGFGVEDYGLSLEEEGGLRDTQAGSHPFQLTTMLTVNQSWEPERAGNLTQRPVVLAKDLNFKLPPGLIGNPTPFPRCRIPQFLANELSRNCPPNTAIGVAFFSFNDTTSLGRENSIAPVFNLEPSVGEPARFGFRAASVPVYIDPSVRTGGDYGVTVSVSNIPQTVSFLSSAVTVWGVPGDPRHDPVRGWGCLEVAEEAPNPLPCSPLEEQRPPPLLSLPTSCTGPLQTSVEADSWAQPGVFQSFPADEQLQALDGCDRLPSSPSISVAPDSQAGSTPTGLTVDVHVPQDLTLNPSGLAEADVKDTTVALPTGVVLNPAAGDGLLACSLGQIALESKEPPSCPDASKVGEVEVKTPLLPNPLKGAAYVAAQNANPFGSLVALYVFVEDPVSGTRVKLAGEVLPDPVTGQLVSTFKNTPQLPFEDFKLHFFGGDRAPLATPALCGPYTTTASITPWSGNPPVDSSSTFNIVSGPNGSACHNPLVFAPSLTVGTTSIQAGGFSPLTTTMSREDGQQALQGIQLHMPPGLSGLLSGVALCGEAQANEGTCPPQSLIGETTVSVGLGGDPFSVKGGKVYITGPYGGAPFGLSIVNPAKAGPYDLGKGVCDCIVVRARIDVDPHTAALTVTTDNTGPYRIPTILGGIPLQIKHVNVTVNREHFTFNPTNCNPLSVTGTIISTEGVPSALTVPFQVTNCATLKFKPSFKVSTTGRTSKANGASLSVKLAYPKAPFGSQANIAKVKVDLPKQLPSRLTTLQKACTAAQFEQNPAGCPPASLIGHAKATTPLLPVPLQGPAYFVSHGGEAFPSLIIVLQGYGVTVDLVGTTFISKAGITSSTFNTVPDVPVGTFELTLPQGKYSALAANGNLCKTKLRMPTTFTAQNALTIHQNTKITVTNCNKHHKHTKKKADKHNKNKQHHKKK